VKHDTLTNGGTQGKSYIPETDVIRLAARSKLPAAEKFESWIFDEVIPSVLNTGTYTNPQHHGINSAKTENNKINFTAEQRLEAARIISQTKESTLPYVLESLNMSYSAPKHTNTYTVRNASKTRTSLFDETGDIFEQIFGR
jgi:prophage antirepressor-like protein